MELYDIYLNFILMSFLEMGFDPSAVPDHAGVPTIRYYSAGSGYSRRGTRPDGAARWRRSLEGSQCSVK